jgi:trans-aconitate methyltransferase
MLQQAAHKAPQITWVMGDLADPHLAVGGPFELVLLAGNVLIFVEQGTEPAVIANLARRLSPGGLLVAGYSRRPGGFDVAGHDAAAERAGLTLVHRWATWDRRPFSGASEYVVSVHQAAGSPLAARAD